VQISLLDGVRNQRLLGATIAWRPRQLDLLGLFGDNTQRIVVVAAGRQGGTTSRTSCRSVRRASWSGSRACSTRWGLISRWRRRSARGASCWGRRCCDRHPDPSYAPTVGAQRRRTAGIVPAQKMSVLRLPCLVVRRGVFGLEKFRVGARNSFAWTNLCAAGCVCGSRRAQRRREGMGQ
jgi:hypothetical protein